MPFDNSMKVENPNPHRSQTISIMTLINYAGDSSYSFQGRAIEILDSLRKQGVVDDKEVEKAKKKEKETGAERIGDEGIKQDDIILELSDGIQLTKELLNTPENLDICEANRNNLNFLPIIQHIDEDQLYRFADSESSQIRKAVAEIIPFEDLDRFFEESNESVLDAVIERIPSIDSENLLQKNEYLNFSQTETLTKKVSEINEFAKIIEDVDEITDNMYEKINSLKGTDFDFAMEQMRSKLEEDKDFNFTSKLEPQKLAEFFNKELETDGDWNPETPTQKEERTGKVKVYRGGKFKDKRGYVSLDKTFAEEFGIVDDWEIDKSRILDLTNPEHRTMVEAEFSLDMLNKLSPDGELPFAGDESVLDDIERVTNKLGFVGSAQSEGEELAISFDIYNSNELDFASPDRIERPSIFGSDAESVEESIGKMADNNYEGLIEIANDAKDEDNELFNKNPKLREKIASKLKPEDVPLFADDKDSQVRMQVAKKIPEKMANEYASGEADPEVLAEYISKLRDPDITDDMMVHPEKIVRQATSNIIQSSVKAEKMLNHEVKLDRGDHTVLSNVLNLFEPEQYKSIVEPLYKETKDWDLKRALASAINEDKFKTPEDFKNLEGFVNADTSMEIMSSLMSVVPEEVVDEYFSPDFAKEIFDKQIYSSYEIAKAVKALAQKQSIDNVVENLNGYADYVEPGDINSIASNSDIRKRFEDADRISDYNVMLDNLISYSPNPVIPRYSHTPVPVEGGETEKDVYVYRRVGKDEFESIMDGGDTGDFWTSAPQSYPAGEEGDYRIVSNVDKYNIHWSGGYLKQENREYPNSRYDGLKLVRGEKNPDFAHPSTNKNHFEQIGKRSKDDIIAIYDHNGELVYSKDKTLADFSKPKYQVMTDSLGKVINYNDAESVVRKYFSDDEIDVQRATRLFVENKAFGSYMDGVISFIENPDISTPYHESVHAYLDGFYTFEEKQELYDAVRELKKDSELTDKDAEEKLADMFFPYVEGKETVTGKIKDYFDKAINFVKGLIGKEDKIKKLFGDIESKKRTTGNVKSKVNDLALDAQLEYYQTPKALTTKLFKMREVEKETMSMQEVKDLIKSKRANLKKTEKELLNRVIHDNFRDKKRINVSEFEDIVARELLPLNVINSSTYADNGTDNLGDDWGGNNDIDEMKTHIYEFPVDTGVGGHFSNETNRLFGHSRVWDSENISYVGEIQSDFFQKYRKELDDYGRHASDYKNTWHERMIREEIRKSAVDGKESIRFPHPFTVAVIEGYTAGKAPYSSDMDDYVAHGTGINYLGNNYTAIDLDNYNGTFTAVKDEYIEDHINISEKYKEEVYDIFVDAVKDNGFNQIEKIKTTDDLPDSFTTSDGNRYGYDTEKNKWYKIDKGGDRDYLTYENERKDMVDDYNNLIEDQNTFSISLKKEILNKQLEEFKKLAKVDDINELSPNQFQSFRKQYMNNTGFDIQVGFFSMWDWDSIDLNDFDKEVTTALGKTEMGDMRNYFERKHGDLISFDDEGGYGDDEYAVILKDGYNKDSEELKFPHLYTAEDVEEDDYIDDIVEKYEKINKKASFLRKKTHANVHNDIPIKGFTDVNFRYDYVGYTPYMPEDIDVRGKEKGSIGSKKDLKTGQYSYMNADEMIKAYNGWTDDTTEAELKGVMERQFEGMNAQDSVLMFYQKQVLPYLKSNRPGLERVEDKNGNIWFESKLTAQDRGAVEAYQEFVPTFYSKLEKAVKDIKGKSIKIERLPNLLRNISQDEIKWSGMNDFVEENAVNGRIDKQALTNYLIENNTKVELRFGLREDRDKLVNRIEKSGMTDNLSNLSKNYDDDVAQMVDIYTEKEGEYLTVADLESFINNYKFTDEQFEQLIKGNLQGIDYMAIYSGNKLTNEQLDMFSEARRTYADKVTREQYIQPLGGEYVEGVITSNKADEFETDEVHFGEETKAISWFRGQVLEDDEFGKTLHIDEVQSRRHDAGKDEGYSISDSEYYQQYEPLRKEINELRDTFPSIAKYEKEYLEAGKEGAELVEYYHVKYAVDANDFHQAVKSVKESFTFKDTEYGKEILKWGEDFADVSSRVKVLDKRLDSIITKAPFENYVPITLKNVLRYAAENQVDGITISTPNQIKDLYNISQKVSKISATYMGNGRYALSLYAPDGYRLSDDAGYSQVTESRLKDLIGNELATNIIENKGKSTKPKWDDIRSREEFYYNGKNFRVDDVNDTNTKVFAYSIIDAVREDITKEEWEENAVYAYDYEDEDLRMGGEWANEMYGEKIPNWLNKYMNKLGIDVSLEQKEIRPGFTQPYLRITGELSNRVLAEGQAMFQKNPFSPAIKELIDSTPKDELINFYNHDNLYIREAAVRKIDSDKLNLFLSDESPLVRDALYERVSLDDITQVYYRDMYVNSLPALRDRLADEMLKNGFDMAVLGQFSGSKDKILSEVASITNFMDKESIIRASEKLKDKNNVFTNERGTEEPDEYDDKVENAEKQYEEPTEETIEVDETDYDIDSQLSPEIKLEMTSDAVIEDGVGEAYKLKNMLDEMDFERTEREGELKETISDKSEWKELSGRDYIIPLHESERKQFEIMGGMLNDIKSIVGDEVKLVGGATRDLLMRQANITNKTINDLDFTVPTYKQIEQLAEYFKDNPDYGVDDSGLKFSHVKAIHKETGFEFEFTSYRKEAYHDDSRKPDVVEGTYEDEIKRRDFSINTLFAKINKVDENGIDIVLDEEVEDFVDDINKGIIRTVDSPDKVFGDDPLRMLRALRFASRYDFEIDPAVLESIQRFDPQTFNKVSGERIKDELGKVLRTGNDIFAYNVISKVFPELEQLYEHSDVIDHINRAVKLARKYDDDVLLWTALLHDVGKPAVAKEGAKGEMIYPKHAEESAILIKSILDRIKPSRKERKAIERLVSIHSRYKELDNMKLGKAIDFAIENKNVFPYLTKFQDIDYFAHAGDFFDEYPEQTNFNIIARMSGIYSVLESVPAEEKAKWEGKDFRSKLKNYISNDLKYREAYEEGAKALYKLYDRKMPVVEDTYLAPNGEMTELTKGQWKQSRSPEFKTWFGDWQKDPENASKVVDENGEPKVVLHGNLSDVEEFDVELTNPENFFGRGIYFSDSVIDIEKNYSHISGPDMKSKLTTTQENIYQNMWEMSDEERFEVFGLTDKEEADLKELNDNIKRNPDAETPEGLTAIKDLDSFIRTHAYQKSMNEAEKMWKITNQGNVMPVYLDIKNPAVIDHDGDDSTMITLELEYDDETGDVIDEGGNAIELYNAITSIGMEFDINGQGVWNSLMQSVEGEIYDGIGLDKIDYYLRNNDEVSYAKDEETGGTAGHEFIKRVYEYMGFDGIIQKNANIQFGLGMSEETTHYVAFKPNQIKSSIANEGAFSKSYNILYQEQKQGDAQYPALTHQEIDDYSKETYKMLQGIIPVTMKDMDRDNGKAVLNGLNSLIDVDPRTAREGTFYHETLHVATEILGEEKAWNQFLTDAGWDGETGSESWTEAQEKLADEFMAYKLDQKDHPYKALFDRVSTVFKKLGDFFTGKKQYYKADYFYKLSKGKLGLRSTYQKNIKNYPMSSQIAHQRNTSIPDEIKDKVINTELKSFGKNPSGKTILRGAGGMLKMDDDFYRHLANDGVKNTEIDLIKFIAEKENITNQQITPDNLKDLISQYMFPIKIENSYDSYTYKLSDEEYDKLWDEIGDDAEREYTYNNGVITAGGRDERYANTIDEELVPGDILERLYDGIDKQRHSNYYGINGGEGYGLQAQGGVGYRELNVSLPFELEESHPAFTNNKTLGWFRVDVDETNLRRLRVNEVQSDVFQKSRMPKEWRELEVSDKFKKNGTEYIVTNIDRLFTEGKDSNILVSNGTIGIVRVADYNDYLKDNSIETNLKRQVYEDKRSLGIEEVQNSAVVTNLQPTWHEYFVKSIIQNAYDSNFDEVSFPAGDTILKIEGHESADEGIKGEKNRQEKLIKSETNFEKLKEEFKKVESKDSLEKMDIENSILRDILRKIGETYYDEPIKELYDFMWESFGKERIKRNYLDVKIDYQIEIVKEDMVKSEKVIKHFEGVKKEGQKLVDFYDKKIAGYLNRIKKGAVDKITDKHGQEWNIVSLNEQDGSPVELFQRKSFNKMFRLSIGGIQKAINRVVDSNIELMSSWSNWFSEKDASEKSVIAHEINSNPELKNALMNNFFQKYLEMVRVKNEAISRNPELGKEIEAPTFKDFLTMDVPVYAMDVDNENSFESWSLVKPNDEAEEQTVVPMNTMGLVDYSKESGAEVMIPKPMTDDDYEKFSTRMLVQSDNWKKLAGDSIVKDKMDAKDYKGVYERLLDMKLHKEELKIGITPATGDIGEISKLLDRSKEFSDKGNFNKVKEYNARVLEFGKTWFDEKFENKTNASFEVGNSIGLFSGIENPTMDITVSFDEDDKQEILTSMIDFAEDFKQNNIHISKPLVSLPEDASLGVVNEDGSTYQMEYNISFKKSLTREQVNTLVDKFNEYNLPGFTLNENNNGITFYNTTTEGEKGYEGFTENSGKLIKEAQSFESFGNVSQDFIQLWNWGDTEFGATKEFEQARSQVFPEQETYPPEEVVIPISGKEFSEAIANIEDTPKHELGIPKEYKLSESTEYTIMPMGGGVTEVRMYYDGVETMNLQLISDNLTEFKRAYSEVTNRKDEILNKFTKGDAKKLFPMFDEVKENSLLYADDKMFYIGNIEKDINRLSITEVGKDGNVIAYRKITKRAWEESLSGIQVEKGAPKEVVPVTTFDEMKQGDKVDNPIFPMGAFEVMKKTSDGIDVRMKPDEHNEDYRESHLSKKYLERYTSRGEYSNRLYDVAEKLNLEDTNPKTSELVAQSPERLIAIEGSGAGNTSYFGKDKEGKNLAIFKPAVGETSSHHHAGINPGTQFVREVADSGINDIYGFDVVPKSIFKNVNGMVGSYQDFVQDAKTAKEYKQELQETANEDIRNLIKTEGEKFDFPLEKHTNTLLFQSVKILKAQLESQYDITVSPEEEKQLEQFANKIKYKIDVEFSGRIPVNESFVSMYIFDYITANGDRHGDNVLITKDGKMHAIDNGYSMPNYKGLSMTRADVYMDITDPIIDLPNSEFEGIKQIWKNLTNIENIKTLKQKFYDTGVLGEEEFVGMLSRMSTIFMSNGVMVNYTEEEFNTTDVINRASDLYAGLNADEAIEALEKDIKNMKEF